MTYGETTVGQTINRLLSEHPDLDPSADGALDNLDQFHAGGADAVDLLIAGLALGEGDRVLDIGSGFGGPARQIARRTGNRVTGVDITPAYVDAARDLTARAGLGDLVHFRAGDIATFEPDPLFQAAITMHVQMNVQDKTAWFAHIARCLAPGARLAIWEVCQPRQAGLSWPMPWSLDGTDSFVVTAGYYAPRSSRPASPPPSGRTKRPGPKPGSPRPSRTACPPDRRCRCSSTTATPG